MEKRFAEKTVPQSTRKNWLVVGQKVRITGNRLPGLKGKIVKVDKRFNRPYTVKVDGPPKSYFSAGEIVITRF